MDTTAVAGDINQEMASKSMQGVPTKPDQRIAFGEGAMGKFATTILRKTVGPALKKMEEHGAMLLIRRGGKYLPTTITKLVISQVEARLSELPARSLSDPKLVMALVGSIHLEGLGMTVGALATKSGVSLVSSAATVLTLEQFKRRVEQAENNKPLTDKLLKVLGDVADALNPLSMGGTATNDTLDSQRTFDKTYQSNLRRLQEAHRQLDAQKPTGQENTNRSVKPVSRPASPPPVRQPTSGEIAALKKQPDGSRPGLARPILNPGYIKALPNDSVARTPVGPTIVGERAEQYTAQQLSDRMQKFAGTAGGVKPSSVFNWIKVSKSGKFDTTPTGQPEISTETVQAIEFNKQNLTVQLAVPIDYWDRTSKQHTQGYLHFRGMDPRMVLTKFNDYLLSLHATQSFNVRNNFEEVLQNSGLSLGGLRQRAQYFDNLDFSKSLPIIGGKKAILRTGDAARNSALIKSNNLSNLRKGQPNKLSISIPSRLGNYDPKPREVFVEGIGANNAAALLQYLANHGLMHQNTSLIQVIHANGLSNVIGLDAGGKAYVIPKAELSKTMTEEEIKEEWGKLGESDLGEQIVRHASREGMSQRDVINYIKRNPGKNLNEILAGLRDGNLSFGGTPPNSGGLRNTNVAGDADLPETSSTINEQNWAEYNSSIITYKPISESIFSNFRNAVSKNSGSVANIGRVIDIGPGRGETVLGVLNEFPNAKVIAIDIDAKNLKVLKDAIPENQKARFESKAGNVTKIDFGINNTNLVVAERLFPHLNNADVSVVLKKAYQALQPEGLMVCDFFTTEHLHAKMNRKIVFRSITEARELVKKDFNIIKEENVGPLVKYTLRKREPGAQPNHQIGNEIAAPTNTKADGIKFDPIPNVINSELNSEYFQGKNLNLKISLKTIHEYTFAGRNFSMKDLAKIARAPDGSKMTVILFEGQPNRIRIEVKNSKLFAKDACTELWIDSKSGHVNIKNLFFSQLPNSPKGMGLQALNQQVKAARAIGVKTIFSASFSSGPVSADKSQFIGPYVWGQYGFDANLPIKIANAIGAPEDVTHINQLYNETKLQARWKDYVLKNQFEINMTLNPNGTGAERLSNLVKKQSSR